MEKTPCDIHLYDSDEYKNCIKDIVYEKAQDEWIMLDPRFPNLKGLTPKRIDEFLENMEDMKEYTEDYLQHVMVYDRDDIVSMCYNLGKQIEEKYLDALHSPHSIFVTTPRGGYEVLSIFAYTNDLKKEQLPSHIRSIDGPEYDLAQKKVAKEEKYERYDIDKEYDEDEENEEDEADEYYGGHYPFEEEEDLPFILSDQDVIKHYVEGNYPTIPDIWLNIDTFYLQNHILRVFIIDDIIASGKQMLQAYHKIEEFFRRKTEMPIQIIPIVLVTTKDIEKKFSVLKNTLYVNETIGIEKWNEARNEIKRHENIEYIPKHIIQKLEETEKIYKSLITVRFPWGSPDGESDKILTTLYESRRGLERIERKQRRCVVEPDACELK